MSRRIARRLRARPEAAGEAREMVREVDLSPRQGTDATLLLSEVVTNSVRHAGLNDDDAIEVVLDAGDVLRVEVRNRGAGFEVKALEPDPARPSGWGLYLVEQLADRWGVDQGPPTTVWFELGA
ncbi:MAG TPA: ATP-binding protein [Solirubrobacteraceae bacterium]|jgi:anti-sigma regulatory factor (Ser/Thr protein kinase)